MSCHVQNSRTLTSLHIEVLSQILMYIEDSDIFADMLTCKTLCSVIMTRHFWYDRIDRLCKEHLVSPPEEELEEYTIAELERWTFRRIRARCFFPTQLQCRSRIVSIPATSDHLLIPGGRWLLIFNNNMPVYFFDLDSDSLNWYILIDPSEMDPRLSKDNIIEKYVWIDHNAPRLSFRLAVSFLDEEDDLHFSWVCICQVNLVGHGASATLVAKIIATFQSPKEVEVKMFTSSAINDRYFVQIRRPRSWKDNEKIEVLDYSRAFGSLDYPLINPHCTLAAQAGASEVRLINGNILVAFSLWSISFHSLDTESPTPTTPLHAIKFSARTLEYSRTCWTPKASLITLTQEGSSEDPMISGNYPSVHGLVIPHDSRRRPWIVDLVKIWMKHADLQLGIFISFVCDRRNGRIERHVHEWDTTPPNTNPKVYVGELWHRLHQLGRLFAFDEDTGRSVHLKRGTMDVIDMVDR